MEINSNFELCKKRLTSLYSLLVANKALLTEYNKIFQHQLAEVLSKRYRNRKLEGIMLTSCPTMLLFVKTGPLVRLG